MRMDVRRHVVLAMEGDKVQAKHVEGGEAGRNQAYGVEHVVPRARGESRAEDLILAPEAGKRKYAADGQTADQEEERGPRQSAAQLAHLADILLVVQRMDDGTGAHKEQGLE